MMVRELGGRPPCVKRPLYKQRVSRRVRSADRVWLFDLDNTLHDASHAIFKRINVSMNQAVVQSLKVDSHEADRLRTTYWHRYGATVIGMHKHHGVKPMDFLRLSHDFDVRPLLKFDSDLPRLLARLPGRKVLLTNAPVDYAQRVLKSMGIYHLFQSIWGVDHMILHGHFRVKPSSLLMRHVLAHEGVSPHRVVLVEDTLKNLRPARRLGMKTVHIHHPDTPFSSSVAGRRSYVDRRINSLKTLLNQPNKF